MRHLLWLFLAAWLVSPLAWAAGAEVIPPSPSPHYIVDEAHVLSAAALQEIDGQLAIFEKETTNQVVVGIYPKMQSDDAIAAYAVRVFQAWKPGEKDRKNGVLLLIFTDDRKLNITTGYGLEGALPDATAHAIIEHDITPRFKAKDYDGGVRAGVASIISATKGEYKAAAPGTAGNPGPISTFLAWVLIILVIGLYIYFKIFLGLGTVFSSRGGGSWGGGGGGGFSGGGGSTGGGGASGSW